MSASLFSRSVGSSSLSRFFNASLTSASLSFRESSHSYFESFLASVAFSPKVSRLYGGELLFIKYYRRVEAMTMVALKTFGASDSEFCCLKCIFTLRAVAQGRYGMSFTVSCHLQKNLNTFKYHCYA